VEQKIGTGDKGLSWWVGAATADVGVGGWRVVTPWSWRQFVEFAISELFAEQELLDLAATGKREARLPDAPPVMKIVGPANRGP
jgi:hypothetical protein